VTETDGAKLEAAATGLDHPVVVTQTDLGDSRQIGRGRSGIVYLDQDQSGRDVARKVFTGDGLAGLVMFLISGAPNPYQWNRHAVRAAVYRRKILGTLVPYWFGGKLKLPETFGAEWNPQADAFELRTEFISGQHLPLRWCAGQSEPDLIAELTGDIMRPLQMHLIEAGFDGMVWQAGLGNPVAGGNFMIGRDRDGQHTWFWIDLESGVPAMFPLNPRTLFRFYLPQTLQYRRPLFDDVDIAVLRLYSNDHGQQIERELGKEAVDELATSIDKLADAQGKWKSLNRTTTSISYFQRRGLLSEHESDWYKHHPWLWQLQSLGLGARCVLLRFISLFPIMIRRYRDLDWAKWSRRLRKFFASARYRQRLADWYALRRIRAWSDRGFIGSEDVRQLRSELQHDHAGECVIDFCVHLSIKPAVKFLQLCVLPLLYMLGILQFPTLVFLEVFGGSMARTAYTSYRYAKPSNRQAPRPWVALVVGVLPVVGNMAFPLQFAYWCRDRQRRIAQFLMYDCFASLGRAAAIWGGENSLVEARANRLPDLWLNRAIRPTTSPADR
jgi:hypothetical protein